MGRERAGFVNVENLVAQVSVEQAAAYYGVALPELRRVGDEIRTRCFLACGRAHETGERAISIQANHPAKIWRCHEAGCGRGGNLVSLCDLMKPGEHMDGKPRGGRFKGILADLARMAEGEAPPVRDSEETGARERPAETATQAERRNRPLAESDNERARGLVNLDEKFIVDPSRMSPRAASYFRARPFLTPERCQAWRMGYLPRDAGGDRGGGTMRGRVVYPWLSEEGEVLTWFGREPDHEALFAAWVARGREGPEPVKYRFVKGFERGLELFGQHRLREETIRDRLARLGLIVVRGPTDVLALDALGVPAVGLCGETMTDEQAAKAARLAGECAGGTVTVMLDCDEQGELAARVALVKLAALTRVRLAWSPAMFGGAFQGRRPESLTPEEWERMETQLAP